MSAVAKSPVLSLAASHQVWNRPATIASIFVADLLGLLVSVLAASFFARILSAPFDLSTSPAFIVLLFGMPAVFFVFGLYSGMPGHPAVEFQSIVKALSVTLMLVASSALLFQSAGIYSRFLLLVAWMLGVVCISASRALVRRLCCHRSWWGIPTVILGEQAFAYDTFLKLSSNREMGLKPIAILTYSPASLHQGRYVEALSGVLVADASVVSSLSQALPGCYVVVAPPSNVDTSFTSDYLAEATRGFSHVFIRLNLPGVSSLWAETKEVGGMLGFKVKQGLDQLIQRQAKRVLDLGLALSLSVFLAPLFILLYFASLVSSGSPVFFGHTRIGRNGRPFTAWKFRSMVPDASRVLQDHLETSETSRAEWLSTQKLKNDPRITPLGKLLRKTSLDELPQIWNVLVGDMSFVGPRPIVAEEIPRYGREYRSYSRVKPGITGLWQISGRNNTTYSERIRLDHYYVLNWSIWFDMYILYHSVKTIVLTEGAY